jgi:hypothetical protein
LSASVGYDFSVLSRLTHGRAIRAIAVAVRDNFDHATNVIGLPLKAVDDATPAGVVANPAQRLPPCTQTCARPGRGRLAQAASFSPALVDDDVIEACRQCQLDAAATVEIIA